MTSMPSSEFVEPVDDILQSDDAHEVPIPPLPVTLVTPSNVILLPAHSGGWRQYPLSTTVPVRILGRDPRRKRAVIMGWSTADATTGIQLADGQALAASDRAFILPMVLKASLDLEVTSVDEVWAMALGAACTVSVLNEHWAL